MGEWMQKRIAEQQRRNDEKEIEEAIERGDKERAMELVRRLD